MQFKRKIPSFIFGLSIGLLIGIAFFLFNIDSIFSKLKASISSNKVTVIEQKVDSDEAKEKAKNKERFKIKSKYASKVNYKEVDSIINAEGDINLAVEQMISSKTIKIIHLNESVANDSLAKNIAGVNTTSSDSYLIEFWKTPLNSKGYRFVKNKIMLYGFTDHNNVLLYELLGRYFIKSFEVVYEIQQSSEFQPFLRVNNPDVLSKLDS